MRFWGVLIFGLAGAGILLGLGIWQVQRLAWKQDVLAEIAQAIVADPVAVPEDANEADHEFLPVRVEGQLVGDTVRVLVSQKIYGAGFRLISAMETAQGRVLVDRGFVSVHNTAPDVPDGVGTIVGNLHWPNEVDSFTPENDTETNFWFARTVTELAAHLETRPVLVIRREGTLDDPGVIPLPVNIEGIPNNHLQYAITWFALALIWVGMTAYFLYRSRETT